MTYQCSLCRQIKDLTDFSKDRTKSRGHEPRCKACRKKTYRKDPAKHIARSRNARLKKEYGIDAAEYEQILKLQDSLCAICKKLCPTGKRLAVDHDHTTRKVRGLLCVRCNEMLGHASDNTAVLYAAILYLGKNT